MSELAKRLREWAEMLRKDGYADCPADLLAVAELVERAEWRPIDLSKLDGETAVLCGTWLSLRKGEKTWAVSAQRYTPAFAMRQGWTHYLPLPAPPAVRP